ncbi:hypothetical protein [uncultured Selenomonas sp.]|uniref:hypothetical protein n=1 Tax=uncultured Selenomonas sp. TaxID=159275 RepID=UPI0028D23830|nr:hypothetical protein [uncultured Selenomonas sp.]
MRFNHLPLFLALLSMPLSCAAVQAAPAAAQEQSAATPRVSVWGDYRWLYGKARMALPSVGARRDVFLSTRRFRVAPTLQFGSAWTVSGMLEDMRYDKDTIGGTHRNDRHLYLSRLYTEHDNGHGAKIRAGRYIFTPIEGNVFDTRVEGVRWRYGDKSAGMTSIFYGRTVGRTARERRRGMILGYERNWARWMGGAFYYDLHTEAPAVTAAEVGRDPLVLHRGIDRQRVLEIFAGHRFDRHRSLELEYLHGRARTDLDGWTARDSGLVATLRLRPSPNVERAGDYGAWIAYYHQPRATYLHHTMNGDPSFFGRAGFRGWGARADVVLTRGVTLAVEGYVLRAAHPAAALVPGRSYSGARQHVLGTTLTAYF